jgi:hypothetical protein
VGTHTADGNFRSRIRMHYDSIATLNGNKNGSVFRKHLGAALMRKDNPSDARLAQWLKSMGASSPDVELIVSRLLRENFTYRCFRVDKAEERLALGSWPHSPPRPTVDR